MIYWWHTREEHTLNCIVILTILITTIFILSGWYYLVSIGIVFVIIYTFIYYHTHTSLQLTCKIIILNTHKHIEKIQSVAILFIMNSISSSDNSCIVRHLCFNI